MSRMIMRVESVPELGKWDQLFKALHREDYFLTLDVMTTNDADRLDRS